MKAYVVEQYGKDAALTEKDVTLGQTGNYDLKIKVEGTSLNPLDTKMFFGHVAAAPVTGILQGDVTGTIIEIGESVTSFSVGDHVIAFGGGLGNRSGALAEEMLVPEQMAVLRPDNLDIATAGCLPVISLTAMEVLKERAAVQSGYAIICSRWNGWESAILSDNWLNIMDVT